MKRLRLEGRVALITGGGTGMGRAIARLFAQEGAKVVVTGRRLQPLRETVEEIVSRGGTAAYFSGDVSKWNDAKDMVGFTVEQFGWVDTLVTCAGVIRRTEKVEETTEEQWHYQIDINLKGTFAMIKFVLPIMMERKFGVIITISSISAYYAAPGYATYCASKGGVSALTRCVALQYAPYGIRANAICPGMVHTPMSYVDRPNFDEIVDDIVKRLYPIGRVAVPEDIASVALFLASDESSYITGQDIFVDGGFTIK